MLVVKPCESKFILITIYYINSDEYDCEIFFVFPILFFWHFCNNLIWVILPTPPSPIKRYKQWFIKNSKFFYRYYISLIYDIHSIMITLIIRLIHQLVFGINQLWTSYFLFNNDRLYQLNQVEPFPTHT